MLKRVLVVDDDPAQRRILEEVIKRLGYETRAVHGGEPAIQVLEGPDRGNIALVLLDLVMPGLDGMGVLDRISGRPRTARSILRSMPCAPAPSTS
jgi:CheY-like chemotaxis protein